MQKLSCLLIRGKSKVYIKKYSILADAFISTFACYKKFTAVLKKDEPIL